MAEASGVVRTALLATVLAGVGLLAACTGPEPDAPAPAPEPPPPPAACLLDLPRFAATTGLTWTSDASTAGDTRCVYDPSGPTASSTATGTATGTTSSAEFVTVEISDAADELSTAAELCSPGTSAPVGAGGFVCRFTGGGPTPGVFAAVARDGSLVTVTASGVPDGTTADRLATAFAEQLG